MPTYTVTTYHCPGCRADVQPNLSLITGPTIECWRCHQPVNVNRDLVVANWKQTVYLYGVLFVWATVVMFAMTTCKDPKVKPWALFVVTALIGWLPAVILALPMMLVGSVAGYVVATWKGIGTRYNNPAMQLGSPTMHDRKWR